MPAAKGRRARRQGRHQLTSPPKRRKRAGHEGRDTGRPGGGRPGHRRQRSGHQDRVARVAPVSKAASPAAPANLGDRVRPADARVARQPGHRRGGPPWVRPSLRTASPKPTSNAESLNAEGDHPEEGLLRPGRPFDRPPRCVRPPTSYACSAAPQTTQRRAHIESVFAVTAPFAGTVDREEGRRSGNSPPQRADVRGRRPEPGLDPGRPGPKALLSRAMRCGCRRDGDRPTPIRASASAAASATSSMLDKDTTHDPRPASKSPTRTAG